jgi:hypothetical protein
MTKPADLIETLFDGQSQDRFAEAPQSDLALSGELRQWMEGSPRFTAFIETYRDKVRKKIRVTRDPESILDLRCELEVAACLLSDRRLEAAYEPYASEKRRGADFAVTYRTNLVFNIEVARIRSEEGEPDSIDLGRKEERITRILLDKLGQMQPGMANLLVIHVRPEVAQLIDLGRLLHALKVRAEGKDPSFYSIARYTGPAAFFKDFSHLSGILLWSPAPADLFRRLWVNKQARPEPPEKVLRLVGMLSDLIIPGG